MSAVPDAVNLREHPSACDRHPCACRLGGTGPAARGVFAHASTTTSTTSQNLDSHRVRDCQSEIVRNRRANIYLLQYITRCFGPWSASARERVRIAMRVEACGCCRAEDNHVNVDRRSWCVPAVVALRPWTTAHGPRWSPDMRLSTAPTGPIATEIFLDVEARSLLWRPRSLAHVP